MKKRMKRMAKKIVLMLSISLAMALNGISTPVNGSTGTEESADYTGLENIANKADVKSADAKSEIEAMVTINGETKYYTDFIKAWKDIRGKKAEIRLCKDINMGDKNIGDNDDQLTTLPVYPGDDITLNMENNVKLFKNSDASALIHIYGGTFTLESGQIRLEKDAEASALIVAGGNVSIKGTTTIFCKNGYALSIYSSAQTDMHNVSISGGNFEGSVSAVHCEGIKISQILANGYAFYNTDTGEWVTDMEQESTGTGVTKVKAEQYPVKFQTHPENRTIQYGDEMPVLRAEAIKTASDAVGDATITYKWFQNTKNGPIEISRATDTTYVPDQKDAGTYEYYCRATCAWFSLNSDYATVTIEKKPLEVEFQGEIVKTYDGTADVNISDIPPFNLKGIIASDTVTTSAIKAAFQSAEPGYHNINVTLDELTGTHAHNYTIKQPVTLKGQIIPLSTTGITLNYDNLSLSVGDSTQLIVTIIPEQGTDKAVEWTSNNPAVATVDQNGKVTITGPGSAVITVTTKDGTFSASCNITASSSSGGGGWWNPDTTITPPKPFLKDSPAKQGWDLISTEAAKAAASGKGTLTIHMNGTVFVPDSFLAAIRGSEVTAVLEMGGGIAWNIYGKDISAEISHETNFSVKQHTGTIPKELIESTAGGLAHLELSFVHDGAFGFTATLTAKMIKDGDGFIFSNRTGNGYTGMYANLYSYNTALHKLEFICADMIREDGTVNLPFTQASDYTLILSASPMGGADAPETPEETEPDQPQEPEKNIPVQAKMVMLSKTLYTYNGKAKKPSVTATDTDGNPISSVGKAMAVVVFKNGYTGTVKKAFTIRPSKTAIKKITGASFGFTVKWAKKSAQTSGYQIQYSTNAGFKEANTHSIYVKKASVTKKPVKKLKTGKKYYVRIRTYKTVTSGGKSTKIFSAWSKAGTVKTR